MHLPGTVCGFRVGFGVLAQVGALGLGPVDPRSHRLVTSVLPDITH